jgi:hypothetical protein
MSSPSNIDRLVARSTFFAGLNARLAALAPLTRLAELQLDVARAVEIQRVRQEHAALGSELHPDDRTFELDDLEQQVTHLLPKLTRGGLILALWSTLERSVKDIAIRAGRHTANPISPTHFRSHFFSAAEKALLSRCGLHAFPDSGQKLKLEFLASVRNTLIHHDGRLDEAPANISALDPQDLAKAGILLERDDDYVYIVPTQEFINEAVALVYAYIHNLADRVFTELVPLSEGDAQP